MAQITLSCSTFAVTPFRSLVPDPPIRPRDIEQRCKRKVFHGFLLIFDQAARAIDCEHVVLDMD